MALAGRPVLDALGDGRDVVGRRTAAAAHDAHAVALDELGQRVGQRLGLLGEDRLPVRALEGQAGVGDAVDGEGGSLAQEADRVAHVLRPGRAVEPDDLNVERGQRRQHRLDVGAQQHLAALRQQGDRALDGKRPAGLSERGARAEHRRLDLEDVLRGLDDQQVGAPLDEALRLLGEHLDQLAEADLPERGVGRGREVPGRADRAGDEAVLARGLPRDLRSLGVDLERVLAKAPLVELEPAGLEGVGLDHLRAGVEHRRVDALDHVGAVEHERLMALALEAAVVLRTQVELLEGRAHAAVEYDDALSHRG